MAGWRVGASSTTRLSSSLLAKAGVLPCGFLTGSIGVSSVLGNVDSAQRHTPAESEEGGRLTNVSRC